MWNSKTVIILKLSPPSASKLDKREQKASESMDSTSQNVEGNGQNNLFFLSENATTSRKIIRTAQVKTKVKNTEGATYAIEQMAQKWRGFVTTNNLENRVIKQEEMPFSSDSMLQIQHSEAVNTLILRVPNRNLDTFLADLSRIYVHLDYRRVNANDLTATFLTNQLKADVRKESSQRIATATDEKGKRLNDMVAAEESRVQMTDEAIAQKVQNEETDYDIAFSTVNIEIYDDPILTKTVVPYISQAATRANFGFRCQQAFANGWAFLLDIFVGVLNLWAIILMAVFAFFLYRQYKGWFSLKRY